MSSFDPSKLSVTLHPPATLFQPLEGRKYTLTHSDETGELFLDVGYEYNVKAIDPVMRDEVIAEWRIDPRGAFQLIGKVKVDGGGEYDSNVSGVRYAIFQKEMGTAIRGLINGDRPFFTNYPTLLDAPIYIDYESVFTQYNQSFNYGTPRQYLVPGT